MHPKQQPCFYRDYIPKNSFSSSPGRLLYLLPLQDRAPPCSACTPPQLPQNLPVPVVGPWDADSPCSRKPILPHESIKPREKVGQLFHLDDKHQLSIDGPREFGIPHLPCCLFPHYIQDSPEK